MPLFTPYLPKKLAFLLFFSPPAPQRIGIIVFLFHKSIQYIFYLGIIFTFSFPKSKEAIRN
jgi:hypothetical protein